MTDPVVTSSSTRAADVPAPANPAVPAEFQAGSVVTVSSAHFMHDMYSSFLAPLLPLLIENLSLTKTAAGLLSIFYQWPSLLQPLIGHWGDRINLKILVILAPSVVAVVMTLLGVAPNYAFLALLLLVAGLNSAGLHSIGPVIVALLSGRQLGRGMSFWMTGGELARTIGPLLVVTAVRLLTPAGLPWLMIGGFAASVMLFFQLRRIPDYRPPVERRLAWGDAYRQIRPILFPVAMVITFRALLFAGLTTFLPTLVTESGGSLAAGGISLSVMEVAGVFGALFGGVISDRLGRRKVMVTMTLAAPLSMLLFLLVDGWLKYPALLLIGLTMLSTTPVIMAIVQDRARESRAMANGIYMAINFATASLATLAMGVIADHFGLRAAFFTSTIVMLAGLPFVFMLPQENSAF